MQPFKTPHLGTYSTTNSRRRFIRLHPVFSRPTLPVVFFSLGPFQGGEGVDLGSLRSTDRVGLYPFWRGWENRDVAGGMSWVFGGQAVKNHLTQHNQEVKKSWVDVVFFFTFFNWGETKISYKNKRLMTTSVILFCQILFLSFFLFRLHYHTMCHEVLENEKWQGAHWLSQYWTSPSCHPGGFGLGSRGQGAQLGKVAAQVRSPRWGETLVSVSEK